MFCCSFFLIYLYLLNCTCNIFLRSHELFMKYCYRFYTVYYVEKCKNELSGIGKQGTAAALKPNLFRSNKKILYHALNLICLF